LPIIPFLAIVAAYGIYFFVNAGWLNKKISIFLVILFLAGNLIMPIIWCTKIIKPATRILAMEWIYKNIDSNANIINFDPYLTLNENRLSIEDKKKYIPDYFLKKDAFLLTKADSEYPKPNFYVLEASHFATALPEELLQKKYQYLIMSWSNQNQRQEMFSIIDKLGIKTDTLAVKFPADAEQNDFNLSGNMRQPYYYLPKVQYNGPTIEIFKIKN